MKLIKIFVQIIKGIIVGAILFEVIRGQTDFFYLWISFIIIIAFTYLDSVISGYKYDVIRRGTNFRINHTSFEHVFHTASLTFGFSLALLYYRDVLPVFLPDFLIYFMIISIPINVYLEYRKIQKSENTDAE